MDRWRGLRMVTVGGMYLGRMDLIDYSDDGFETVKKSRWGVDDGDGECDLSEY